MLYVTLAMAGCTEDGHPLTPLPYNLHVLDEGRAYRSSQPTGAQLENIIDLYDIRTVVNLRGPNPGEGWYDDEAAVCARRGVALVDHPMSANALPSAELLSAVIDTLLSAEYPILIHCNGGADRSGAVSAIYRMLVQGADRAEALEQVSPRYFHFRAATPCMDTLAEHYEPAPEWLDWYAANVDQLTCR